MKPIRKLLAIRLSALGDICMTLPVIDSFCRTYPSIELTLLTSKMGSIIATTIIHHPNFKVRICNKNDYRGFSGVNNLYNELKELNFDAVADLHNVLRTKWSALRFRLSGVQVKVIDKGRSEKHALVSHTDVRQLKSGFQRYQQVFADLGFPFELDYDGKKASAQLSSSTLSSIGVPSIGIAPFAQHKGKIYPADLMCKLIDVLLNNRPDLRIYLFGSKEEAPTLEAWRSAHPDNIINLAGTQSIADDLQVISQLKAMVSMDSANMHLASLLGVRCFSIWGATHRYAGFLGYGQKPEDCIEAAYPCRPCSIYGNKPCKLGDYRCLNDISPEQAADKILKSLL